MRVPEGLLAWTSYRVSQLRHCRRFAAEAEATARRLLRETSAL